MAVSITEYGGAVPYRNPARGFPIASYSISSLSTGNFPSAGAGYIRAIADAGSLLTVLSTSTATTLTSTNATRIAANAPPELFAVSTAFRIMCAST